MFYIYDYTLKIVYRNLTFFTKKFSILAMEPFKIISFFNFLIYFTFYQNFGGKKNICTFLYKLDFKRTFESLVGKPTKICRGIYN
jgi:hypothetical protein